MSAFAADFAGLFFDRDFDLAADPGGDRDFGD